MNNVVWHKIGDYDFPNPWKDILILDERGRFSIGYYQGESAVYPWYDYYTGLQTKGKYLVAWCELPDVPSFSEVVRG